MCAWTYRKQTAKSASVFSGLPLGDARSFPFRSQDRLTDGLVGVESYFIDGASVAGQLIQNPPACGVPHVHKPARYHEEKS